MSEERRDKTPEIGPGPDAERDSNLVDIFEEEETRRFRPSDLEPDKPENATEEDYQLEERDYRPIRFRRDGRTGCLGGLMYAAFVICVSVILACALWMAACDVLALNKDPLTATVTLDRDQFSNKTVTVTDEETGAERTETVRYANLDYVANALKSAGIIEYRGLFKFYCRFSHAAEQIDPGTYELSTSFDYRALVKKMQVGSGAMVATTVTIPEGFTMDQIFQRLEEEGVCAYDDLLNAAANYQYNYSFLDENALGDPARLEGFLFPDTYEFYQGMQASSAINKFLVNFHDRLTREVLDLAQERGLTLQQAITIASMIEKEAANDDERALIASVIYNRLSREMPLQIDSPYNTYLHTGLPPTPIANPGIASIDAAVKPASTNYLYYALDAESGVHKFFTSYSEFEAFVAQQSYSQ